VKANLFIIAIALDQIAGGYRVTLADGQSIDAAAVVIATGNNLPAPAWPIQGQGIAYIDNPWSEDATADLDPLAPVLIIGTGRLVVLWTATNFLRACARQNARRIFPAVRASFSNDL
jgi:uncharacterized NAD(P)/FAD-binding protein YdhS